MARSTRIVITERCIIDDQIEQRLRDGIIEHCESEYSSPVVLVVKRDHTARLCIDYRRINKVIVQDILPLPLIEDQLRGLQDAHVFSTLDLKHELFLVNVDKETRKFTSFVTHNDQYQFLKVPFGLSRSGFNFLRRRYHSPSCSRR